MTRPKLANLHGLSESEIDTILVDLARHAIILTPANTKTTPVAPDPGDQFLWDLLASLNDLVLVTGDELLRHNELMRNRVTLPQEFAAHLAG